MYEQTEFGCSEENAWSLIYYRVLQFLPKAAFYDKHLSHLELQNVKHF